MRTTKGLLQGAAYPAQRDNTMRSAFRLTCQRHCPGKLPIWYCVRPNEAMQSLGWKTSRKQPAGHTTHGRVDKQKEQCAHHRAAKAHVPGWRCLQRTAGTPGPSS